MVRLFITSMSDFSGKSLVSVGTGLMIRDKGFTVGYVKPVGKDPVRVGRETSDADALVIREALGLSDPYRVLSPYILDFEEVRRTLQKKTSMLAAVIKNIKAVMHRDVVIVEWASNIFDGAIVGASGIQVAGSVDAEVLVVEGWRGDVTIDLILSAADIIGAHFAGAVINMVPQAEMDYVRKVVAAFLKKRGITVFGVIPKDPVLGSVAVRQLGDALNGKVLCREDMMDELVEHYLVGAMDVDSAMKYFRRTPNKAVITGGHRTDIQLAALETSTKCIILTGGLYTNDVIISKAEAAGIPVIAVAADTFTVVEKIESVLGRTHLRGAAKVRRAYSLIKENLDFGQLAGRLGLRKR